MFTVTPDAARQIHSSTSHSKSDGLPLRIAASKKPDNSIHYGMGFDEKTAEDSNHTSEGIEIIIAPASQDLLKNTVLDYVELEPDKFQFIFIDPDKQDNNNVAPE